MLFCSGHRHDDAQQTQLPTQTQHKLHPPEKQPRDAVWHPALRWSGLLRNQRSGLRTYRLPSYLASTVAT